MPTRPEEYFNRPDGEVFVDEPQKTLPPSDTWEALSANQLLEVQVALETRLWEFRQNKAMAQAIQASLGRLQGLLSAKMATGQ